MQTITVDSVASATLFIEIPESNVLVDPIVPGPLFLDLSSNEQGPPGSVELVVNTINSSDATVIDYAKGTWQRLVLQGDVSTLDVVNWPDVGKAARLVLEIENTGSFAINGWPDGTRWPGGFAPLITNGAGTTDIVVLSTGSGGSPIYGSLVGQNFS